MKNNKCSKFAKVLIIINIVLLVILGILYYRNKHSNVSLHIPKTNSQLKK